jgi:hypothetical protein
MSSFLTSRLFRPALLTLCAAAPGTECSPPSPKSWPSLDPNSCRPRPPLLPRPLQARPLFHHLARTECPQPPSVRGNGKAVACSRKHSTTTFSAFLTRRNLGSSIAGIIAPPQRRGRQALLLQHRLQLALQRLQMALPRLQMALQRLQMALQRVWRHWAPAPSPACPASPWPAVR